MTFLECHPCVRTPVTYVSGLYTAVRPYIKKTFSLFPGEPAAHDD